MTGPYHYKRAEEILAEIEAANAAPDQTEAALAIRAQAHAILALAATAIDPGGQRHEWHDVAGVRYVDTSDRVICRAGDTLFGELVTVEWRLAEIHHRYRPGHLVRRSIRHATPIILRAVEQVQGRAAQVHNS